MTTEPTIDQLLEALAAIPDDAEHALDRLAAKRALEGASARLTHDQGIEDAKRWLREMLRDLESGDMYEVELSLRQGHIRHAQPDGTINAIPSAEYMLSGRFRLRSTQEQVQKYLDDLNRPRSGLIIP